MLEHVAQSVLQRLMQFMSDYSVPYHFSCGSLLGLVRDGKFITDDTDIDINVYVPYVPFIFELKPVLKQYDLYISRDQIGNPKDLPLKRRHIMSRYLSKDRKVFGQIVNDKVKYMWRISINGTRDGEGMDDNPSTFRWIDIYGSHWFPQLDEVSTGLIVPKNSSQYLRMIYGDKWNVPVARESFDRPISGYPIHALTIMSKSEYGQKYSDPKYPYISEKLVEDVHDIHAFIRKVPSFSNVWNRFGLNLNDEYQKACVTPSDINEHLPKLRKYSSTCDHVIELGVRSGISSYAFLMGLKDRGSGKLISVDLVRDPNIDKLESLARKSGINYEFVTGDDLKIDLPETDLLFIDTWHCYGQLVRELEKYHQSTRKFIIMHDTTVDGDYSELVRMPNRWNNQKKPNYLAIVRESGFNHHELHTGLWPAVVEFLNRHHDWKLLKRYTNNNGLTILGRISS